MKSPTLKLNKNRNASLWLFCMLLAFAAACTPEGKLIERPLGDFTQPDPATRSYAIYLLGDAGELPHEDGPNPLSVLEGFIAQEGPNSAVVYLGDNIYPSGMPAQNDPGRAESEHIIDRQTEPLEDYEGQVVFIPGNHDWGGRGIGGERARLRLQEIYVEDKLDRGNSFLPDRGFPGPVEVALNNEITLVALDTQWWFEEDRPETGSGIYDDGQERNALVDLDNVLRRNKGKRIVIVGHHPIFSDGSHSGQSGSQPLSLIRQTMGTPQDFSNFRYRRFRQNLLNVLSRHEGLIYAAGHEHSLQYLRDQSDHHIVSGSASEGSSSISQKDALFASNAPGFARLMFYTNGAIWLEFWEVDAGQPEGRRSYAVQLEEATRQLITFEHPKDVKGDIIVPEETEVLSGARGEDEDRRSRTLEEVVDEILDASPVPYTFVAQDTVRTNPGDYKIAGIIKWLMGERYREVWATPINIPVIDLEKTAGGLTPIKKGGGFQTTSLRLKGEDGDQYVLRSINKDASAVLPDFLRDTIADDIVEDQTSGMHPYGAFVVPFLADAARIYHTEPKLVVIPDHERLGIYREELAGTVALFETRPNKRQRDELRFGQPEDIMGSEELFDKLSKNNERRLDAHFYARSRLFDMFMGDWDRHQDQWRWAAFEPYELFAELEGADRTSGKVYRPIPRDRDFVFFRLEGLLTDMIQNLGGPRVRLSKFGPKIKHLKGLNLSASNLDKRFTASMVESDWVIIAESIRDAMTDEVIESAIQTLAPEIFAITGESMIANLKQRREQLPEVARRYYKMLARTVEVVGSDEDEEFIINKVNDDETQVRVYKISRYGIPTRELYNRTFHASETKEIRLLGLGGVDQFIFEGEGNNKIRIRASGGFGADTYTELTSSARGRNHIYDSPEGNTINVSKRTKTHFSTEPEANLHIPQRFGNPNLMPALGYALDSEDGLFLGGGLQYTNPGFLYSPYRNTNKLVFKQSLSTRAYDFTYEGHATRLFGNWSGRLNAQYQRHRNIRHFFGLGNGSDGSEENRLRFRAQYASLVADPSISKHLGYFTTIQLGLNFSYMNVDDLPEITEGNSGFSDEDFLEKIYAGAKLALNIDGTDDNLVTRSGASLFNVASFNVGVHNSNNSYLHLSSVFSYYYPLSTTGKQTLAVRVGVAHNVGDFEFFQANYLSGRSNLRGYERDRFAGRTSFYNNIEFRTTLIDYADYFIRGEVGLLAFLDHGRVWSDVNNNGPWRAGYGLGVWFIPFSSFIVNTSYGISSEGQQFDVFLNFLF